MLSRYFKLKRYIATHAVTIHEEWAQGDLVTIILDDELSWYYEFALRDLLLPSHIESIVKLYLNIFVKMKLITIGCDATYGGSPASYMIFNY